MNKAGNTSRCPLILHLYNSCNLVYGVLSQQSQDSLGLLLGLLEMLQLQQPDMIHQFLGSCSRCPLTLQLLQFDVWQRMAVSCRRVVALTIDVWYWVAGAAGWVGNSQKMLELVGNFTVVQGTKDLTNRSCLTKKSLWNWLQFIS